MWRAISAAVNRWLRVSHPPRRAFHGVHVIEAVSEPVDNLMPPAVRVAALKALLASLPRDALGNHLWPADPDEVPRWIDALDEMAAICDLPRPSYRTLAEFRRNVALCEAAARPNGIAEQVAAVAAIADAGDVEPFEMVTARLPEPALRPALAGHEAAGRFLGWLREHGHLGEIRAAELGALYRTHAAGIGHVETSDKAWRSALGALPGVSSRQVSDHGPRGRTRPVVWTIKPAASPAPLRRAA